MPPVIVVLPPLGTVLPPLGLPALPATPLGLPALPATPLGAATSSDEQPSRRRVQAVARVRGRIARWWAATAEWDQNCDGHAAVAHE